MTGVFGQKNLKNSLEKMGECHHHQIDSFAYDLYVLTDEEWSSQTNEIKRKRTEGSENYSKMV